MTISIFTLFSAVIFNELLLNELFLNHITFSRVCSETKCCFFSSKSQYLPTERANRFFFVFLVPMAAKIVKSIESDVHRRYTSSGTGWWNIVRRHSS